MGPPKAAWRWPSAASSACRSAMSASARNPTTWRPSMPARSPTRCSPPTAPPMRLENPAGPDIYGQAVLEESGYMSLESLKVLEGRVDDVVARHAAVCAERDRLQEQLT